jgi:ATP-dependent RNA helicase RhlE
MEVVPGFEPSRSIRSDAKPFDNAPRSPRPARNRRPHGKPRTAEAHAHAGPKQPRDGRRGNAPGAGRRDSRQG